MKWRTLLALFPSFLFCLRYLPFRQAIKIPIIIYKPHFYCLGGKVIIDSSRITFGMIRLGLFITSQYPNGGIRWYNKGTIVFRGKVCIGANSSIFLLRKGSYLSIGNNFGNATTLRINCDYKIILGDGVRIGWDVTIMDSSMHRLKDMNGHFLGSGYGEIFVGEHTWIASQCMISSGSKLPAYTIVSARSLVNKHVKEIPGHCLIAGTPAKLIKQGVWRDLEDDKIEIEN